MNPTKEVILRIVLTCQILHKVLNKLKVDSRIGCSFQLPRKVLNSASARVARFVFRWVDLMDSDYHDTGSLVFVRTVDVSNTPRGNFERLVRPSR